MTTILPNRTIRGIRDSMPGGYVLGRSSGGVGRVEMITTKSLAQVVDEKIANAGGGLIVQGIQTSGSGIANVGGTLEVEWNGGTVDALGPGISINSGTLDPNWALGDVTALGTNSTGTLSLSSGTLSVTTPTVTQEWQAGTVTALGPNLAINSGTIEGVVIYPTGVTWNTSDAHSGSFLFSNGNLTVSNNGALSQWYSGRATASVSSGKWYAELLCVATDAGDGLIFGLANGSQVLTNYVGSSNNGIGYQTSGDVWLNGTAIQPDTGSDGFGNGQYAAIAWDMGAKLVWFYSPVNGHWNNSGSANPATGVGGYSFSAISGALYLAFSMEIAAGGTNADEGTLNVGASAFNYTVPAGFSPAGQATTAITNIGAGLTIASGTLSVNTSGVWNAGTVNALGTTTTGTLSISGGTLNVTTPGLTHPQVMARANVGWK